jgi:HEAT repeat protein
MELARRRWNGPRPRPEDSLPLLGPLLQDHAPDVRAAAALAWARAEGPIEPLLEQLDDRDRPVREASVLALGLRGGAVAGPALVRILDRADEPAPRRGLAAIALGLAHAPEAVPSLVRALASKDRFPDVPVSAVLALGLIGAGHAEATAALLSTARRYRTFPMLHPSSDELVRAHALEALGRVWPRGGAPVEVIACLRSSLVDRDSVCRRSALLALGRLLPPGDPLVEELIRIADTDFDPTTRRWALISLGRVGGPRAFLRLEVALGRVGEERAFGALGLAISNALPVERVAHALEEERDRHVAAALAWSLALAGHRPTLGDLRRHLPARDADRDATLARGLLGGPGAGETLLLILSRTGDRSVAGAAAVALGLLGERDALEPLGAIARDSRLEPWRRAVAVSALGLLVDRRSPPPLARLAEDLNFRALVDPIRAALWWL